MGDRRTVPFCKMRLAALLGVFFLLIASGPGYGAIAIGEPLRVRILYDNSGSMYPGYAPGHPETSRSASGTRYFDQYPEFQQWLADFIASQAILDGGTVSLWTSTSQREFSPGDVREVYPETPISGFDVSRAVSRFPQEVGDNTYLAESLDRVSRGFQGLVWLITDNIVETSAGEPNADVRRFFQTLHDEPRYRSVHLFKYPFRDERAGRGSALAIYGILVSEADVPDPTLAHYDGKFQTSFRSAHRRQGDPLFPGQEHLKLKDLRIQPLELAVEMILDDSDKGQFKEGQTVRLELSGKIKSHLTQHSVTGGRYRLEPAGPFEPESWAARDLGARKLAPALFQAAFGEIGESIPPAQSRDVKVPLHSSQPVSFGSGGLGAWLRLAMNGAVVKYTGRVRMSFEDIQVRLERDQMAGIFGIGEASDIFNIQDVSSLPAVTPSEATVSFALRTGSSRTALFLLLLALLSALLGIPAALLSRKRWYHVRISGTPERLVPLRRLGSHQVLYEGQPLGRLSRGIAGEHEFTANAGSAAFTITPARQPDTYDVRFRDGRGCQISIEPQGGGRPRRAQAGPGAPAGGAPPTASRAAPPPARALPKIDRP